MYFCNTSFIGSAMLWHVSGPHAFMAEWYSTVWVYQLDSSTHQLLDIKVVSAFWGRSSASVNIWVQVFVWACFLLSWYVSTCGIAASHGNSMFNSLRTQSTKVDMHFYLLSSNTCGFQFFQFFVNTCLYQSFWLQPS